MNEDSRQFAVLVVGVAIVGGAAWHLGVRNLMVGLESDRAAMVQYAHEIEQGKADFTPGAAEQTLAAIEAHADKYRRVWAEGSDASLLYERLQNLAVRSGVRIENIEPGRGGSNAEEAARLKALGVKANREGYSIEISGSFTSIRSFLAAVQFDSGLARIESFRIQPAMNATDPDMLHASVATSYRSIAGVLQEPENGGTP
ncbi:MAG: hypothetical protein DHS20C14_10440 [Phycisphaeraceae bacterium]|nr:MAG: hypothetical protein DHS20C14_10440 [Phycisphaeraceae bacterium]